MVERIIKDGLNIGIDNRTSELLVKKSINKWDMILKDRVLIG